MAESDTALRWNYPRDIARDIARAVPKSKFFVQESAPLLPQSPKFLTCARQRYRDTH